MAAITPTADVSVSGPVDGMGEPDKSGAYILVSISTARTGQRFRISLGAAEVLAAELASLLGAE